MTQRYEVRRLLSGAGWVGSRYHVGRADDRAVSQPTTGRGGGRTSDATCNGWDTRRHERRQDVSTDGIMREIVLPALALVVFGLALWVLMGGAA